MNRRVVPWTVTGLLVLACSSGETPSDENKGSAGKAAAPAAGSTGMAGTSSASAGKASAGTGGGAGTGTASAGTSASAGTTSMPSAGSGGVGGVGAAGGPPQAGAGPMAGAGGGVPTAGSPGAGAGGASGGGAGGAPTGGMNGGGAPGAGMGGMPSSTASYTCNQVVGIDSTGEWFTGGFETQVPDGKWQINYHHPGYVEDWADPNDEVWTLTPTSACTTNSTNPDRVIFNIYSETLTDKTALVTSLNKAITNFKSKYSRLQRIDILTMTRSPDNMPCAQGKNGAVVAQYVDDAAAMVVSAGPPPVIAAPKFAAKDCTIFTDGGPHFTDPGKAVAAKIYGDYYSTEP